MHVWSKLSSAKWRDAWEERFLGLGQTNAVISELPGGKSVRVEVYCEDERTAQSIAEQFGGSVRELKMQNWAAMAPPQRNPIKIRDTILVTGEPDGEKLDALRAEHAGRHVISIPAELAFGTGDHATTSTCLRLLSDFANEFGKVGRDWSMLDLGTGSGLLAVAAMKLGADPVEGFDFDPTAVGVAQRNARRNSTPGAKLYEADVFQWQPDPGKWDVIVANIFADILEANLDKIATALKPGGKWVVSGILRESEPGVVAAAREAGLPEPTAIRKGKWVTLFGSKAES
jgi:ribosomal protein L11 methyltransferase